MAVGRSVTRTHPAARGRKSNLAGNMTHWCGALTAVAIVSIATAPLAFAHEGHVHKTMGTVATVHEHHLEVKDTKGVVTTHVLDDTTKIVRGKVTMKLAEMKVGDRVVVSTLESKDKSGKVTKRVTEVQLGVAATTAAKK